MAVFDSICDTEINECLICKENNLNFHTPCCNQRMHEKCLNTWFKKTKIGNVLTVDNIYQ